MVFAGFIDFQIFRFPEVAGFLPDASGSFSVGSLVEFTVGNFQRSL
jgi:hypothetical protein